MLENEKILYQDKMDELWLYCIEGETRKVKSFLSDKENKELININDDDYIMGPLIAAAGNAEVLKVLLDNGLKIEDGYALSRAASKGRLECVKLLVNAKGGTQALESIRGTIEYNNNESVKQLLDQWTKENISTIIPMLLKDQNILNLEIIFRMYDEEEISLKNSDITDKEIIVLKETFQKFPYLKNFTKFKKLDLRDNKIGDDTIKILVEILEQLPQFKKLKLSTKMFTKNEQGYLEEKSIDLNKAFAEEDITKFFDCLPKLKVLQLGNEEVHIKNKQGHIESYNILAEFKKAQSEYNFLSFVTHALSIKILCHHKVQKEYLKLKKSLTQGSCEKLEPYQSNDFFIKFLAALKLHHHFMKEISKDHEDLYSGFSIDTDLSQSWNFPISNKFVIDNYNFNISTKAALKIDQLKSSRTYSDAYKLIKQIKETVSLTADKHISDPDIAYWIQLVIKGSNIKTLPYYKTPEHGVVKSLLHSEDVFFINLAKVTNILLGYEVLRNPAALIHNFMVLDLIKEKNLTWKQACGYSSSFINKEAIEKFSGGGGLIPMCMKGATTASTTLHNEYAQYMPTKYCYNEHLDKNKLGMIELIKRENEISTKWLQMKTEDSNLEMEDTINLIAGACKDWFDLEFCY